MRRCGARASRWRARVDDGRARCRPPRWSRRRRRARLRARAPSIAERESRDDGAAGLGSDARANARALSSPCGGRVAAADDRDRRHASSSMRPCSVQQQRRVGRFEQRRADSADRRARCARGARPSVRRQPSHAMASRRCASQRLGSAGQRLAAPRVSTADHRPASRARRRDAPLGRAEALADAAAATRPTTTGSRAAAARRPSSSRSITVGAPRRRRGGQGWVKRSPGLTGSLTDRISAYDMRSKTRNTNSTPCRFVGQLDRRTRPLIGLVDHACCRRARARAHGRARCRRRAPLVERDDLVLAGRQRVAVQRDDLAGDRRRRARAARSW